MAGGFVLARFTVNTRSDAADVELRAALLLRMPASQEMKSNFSAREPPIWRVRRNSARSQKRLRNAVVSRDESEVARLVSTDADRGRAAARRFHRRGAAAEESQDNNRAEGREKNVSHSSVGFLLNRKTRLR